MVGQVEEEITMPSCEWQKDDQPLSCLRSIKTHLVTNSYHGFHSFMLCMHVENLTTEGTYKGIIKCHEETLTSKTIVLTINSPIDRFINVLTDFYNHQSEVPEDTWPPTSGNTYISLSLVKHEGIHHAGRRGYSNSADQTVYEMVFNSLDLGARLLIEGCSGSGKTTLVHKFSQDWARGKFTLKYIKAVFMVQLRAFSSNPNLKLHDILECFYSCTATVEEVVKYAERHSGLGLCFVLDGLDEFFPNDNNTFISRLIKKQVLPKAVVIAASSPAAASKYRTVATDRVEVTGFSRDQIRNYVEQYPFSHQSKCDDLHVYLDRHPNVQDMCYLPIHAAMVCFLFNNLESADLPHTETEIYKEFTNYTILRYWYRSDASTDIYLHLIENLPSPQKETYIQICM